MYNTNSNKNQSYLNGNRLREEFIFLVLFSYFEYYQFFIWEELRAVQVTFWKPVLLEGIFPGVASLKLLEDFTKPI